LLDRTAAHWGEHYFSQSFNRQEWQAHPLSIQRQYELQGHQMREGWFATRYLHGRPARRAASFGAGRAETEIAMLEIGAVEHFDLYDVSPVGIEYAKECASKKGFGDRVTCHVGPVMEAHIPEGTYDLAMFVASLHHMEPLADTLRFANRVIKDDGFIWCANEYIGPDRFNYPERHAAIAKCFFHELPATLRSKWHEHLPLPTPQEVASVDPTEAPCSSLIEPTMRRMFPRLEMTPLYGGFAFIVFWGLNHDALYETPEGAELVRFILCMDKALGDSGVLPSYFAHIVARKTTRWQERAIQLGIDPQGALVRRTLRLKDTLTHSRDAARRLAR
jgi:SAM-dependent methyltransferase